MRTIWAGYVLTRPVPRPPYSDAELLPDRIVSLSGCICPRLPDAGLMWSGDPSRIAERLGIEPTERGALAERLSSLFEAGDIGPEVLLSADAITRLAHRFDPDGELWPLVLGIPEDVAQAILSSPRDPTVGESGLRTALARGLPVPDACTPMGWEPICLDEGTDTLGCSWLCNGLERHSADVLGLRPQGNGLLPDEATARACCAEIGREEVGAEPGMWIPVFLGRLLTRNHAGPREPSTSGSSP